MSYPNTVIPSDGSNFIIPARDQNLVSGVTPEITKIIEVGIPGRPGPRGPKGDDGVASGFPYTGSAIISGSLIVTGSTSLTSDLTVGGFLTADSSIVENALIVRGNTSLGNNAATDTVSFISTINSNFTPSSDRTHNLGNSTSLWNQIYADSASVGYITSSYVVGTYGEFSKVNINGTPILSAIGQNQLIGDRSADKVIIDNTDFEVSASMTVGDSITVENDITASNGLFDILILKNQESIPTPISGGVYYSNGDFFMGV